MSCNFRQPLAGVGDLSSSQPSSSSASASYLWPPSKVNMLPQVQINSTLTEGLPLLLHLSTSTHTSPTTGEIRASLADLTAPQNTAPDRSLIAWLDPLSTPQCTHTHVHTHTTSTAITTTTPYLCLWPKARCSILHPLLTHS